MSRILLYLAIFVATLPNVASADIFTGSTSWNFDPDPGINLFLTINTNTDVVDIVMEGRTDGWFGVGFGNVVMNGTYGIIVHQDGNYDERVLNYAGGSVISNSLSLVSNNVSGSVRTMHFQRGISGLTASHFTFPAAEGTLQLIGATDSGSYQYHGATRRASNSVLLTAVPEPGTATMLLATTCLAALRRRRQR